MEMHIKFAFVAKECPHRKVTKHVNEKDTYRKNVCLKLTIKFMQEQVIVGRFFSSKHLPCVSIIF